MAEIHHPAPQQAVIAVRGEEGVGNLSISPPTFLERWGIVFVACAGAWMLVVAGVLLSYYLRHLPSVSAENGRAAEIQASVNAHKAVYDQYRDSLSYIFDLLVTKTVLPLITLLLGYLFGVKAQSR